MKGYILDNIFQNFGMYNEMGFEESDQRYYLTFSCGSGIFVAVMVKKGVSNEIAYYKFDKRSLINEN